MKLSFTRKNYIPITRWVIYLDNSSCKRPTTFLDFSFCGNIFVTYFWDIAYRRRYFAFGQGRLRGMLKEITHRQVLMICDQWSRFECGCLHFVSGYRREKNLRAPYQYRSDISHLAQPIIGGDNQKLVATREPWPTTKAPAIGGVWCNWSKAVRLWHLPGALKANNRRRSHLSPLRWA